MSICQQIIIFPSADALLNDLAAHPHAFVLACVMDRQIKAERAWLIPYRIAEKLRGFSMETLCQLSPADVKLLMSQPEPLHRFIDTMSGLFQSAVQRISSQYANDAARIWTGSPPSAEVVCRFLEFDGVGPKIGSMAANILARDFKIPLADYFSIDISADVHIRRVFARLGLCARDATVEQVIFEAKALHLECPGMSVLRDCGPGCGCHNRDTTRKERYHAHYNFHGARIGRSSRPFASPSFRNCSLSGSQRNLRWSWAAMS